MTIYAWAHWPQIKIEIFEGFFSAQTIVQGVRKKCSKKKIAVRLGQFMILEIV